MNEIDRSQGRNFSTLIAAALLALCFGAVAVWWVCTDTRPQQMDPATHLRRSISYADAIRAASPSQLYSLWRAEYGLYTYPPLFHVASGAVIAAGASPELAAALVNSAFAFLLLLSVINLGRAAFSFTIGLVGGALCLLFMPLAFLQRTAFPDFALTAMVAWCCWRLVLCEGFSRRSASVIFGLSVGAALLVKQVALPFIGLPAALVLLAHWKRMNRSAWFNIVLASAAAGAVALPWYGFHLRLMSQIGRFNQYITPAREGDPMPWTFEGATYYLQTLVSQLGPPLMILAFVSGVGWWLLVRKSHRRALPNDPHARDARRVIITWLLGGFLLVTFVLFNKDYRYHVPILPALSLLVASLLALPTTRAGRGAVAALILLAAAPYFFLATVGTRNPSVPKMLMTRWNMPPVRENWRLKELVDDVAALAPDPDVQHPPRLGVVPYCESYGHPSLHLEFARRGLPVRIEGIAEKDPSAATLMDLVLTKTGEQGQDLLLRDPELVNRYIANHPRTFVAVASYWLPDGSRATLYQVRKQMGE